MSGSLTPRSETLRARPIETKPQCAGSCTMVKVSYEFEEPMWRCEQCLRYYNGKVQQGGLFD